MFIPLLGEFLELTPVLCSQEKDVDRVIVSDLDQLSVPTTVFVTRIQAM